MKKTSLFLALSLALGASTALASPDDRPWYDVRGYFYSPDHDDEISVFGARPGQRKPVPDYVGEKQDFKHYESRQGKNGGTEFISFSPKGSFYLVQNLIANCQGRLHIAAPSIATHWLEEALLKASSSDLIVRAVINAPLNLHTRTRLHDLMVAGVDIRLLDDNPILSGFAVCDGKTVATGILEPFDNERHSYGFSSVSVSYKDDPLAMHYENQWSELWGHAYPFRGDRNKYDSWMLFGSGEGKYNDDVKPYRGEGHHQTNKNSTHYHLHSGHSTLFR